MEKPYDTLKALQVEVAAAETSAAGQKESGCVLGRTIPGYS